jgi:hypothetical protein
VCAALFVSKREILVPLHVAYAVCLWFVLLLFIGNKFSNCNVYQLQVSANPNTTSRLNPSPFFGQLAW